MLHGFVSMFRVLYALSRGFIRQYLGIYMWLRHHESYCLSKAVK